MKSRNSDHRKCRQPSGPTYAFPRHFVPPGQAPSLHSQSARFACELGSKPLRLLQPAPSRFFDLLNSGVFPGKGDLILSLRSMATRDGCGWAIHRREAVVLRCSGVSLSDASGTRCTRTPCRFIWNPS